MCLGKTFNEKTHLDFIENTYRFLYRLNFFFWHVSACVDFYSIPEQWALSVVSSTTKMYVNGNSFFAK